MATLARDFLLDFIMGYKEEECLWKITSPHYRNMSKRTDGYARLLTRTRRYDPSATRESVIKKIGCIRAVFRRERRKVIESQRNGDKEIFVPRLWYYEHLSFLSDQEEGISESGQSTSDRKPNKVETWEDMPEDHEPKEEPFQEYSVYSQPVEEGYEYEDPVVSDSESITHLPYTAPRGNPQPPKRKRLEEKVVDLLSKCVSQISDFDNSDIFGRNVAAKLKSMDTEQRIFAERVINDALYFGELAQLTADSHVVVVDKDRVN